MDPSQVLLQAEVNTDDEDDNDDRSPNKPSAPKIEPEKLYPGLEPTAPHDEFASDANSTASAHSTSV
jgi:hypothetical protein